MGVYEDIEEAWQAGLISYSEACGIADEAGYGDDGR